MESELFGHRQGSIYRAQPPTRKEIPESRRWHAVPRRSGRHEFDHAVEGFAGWMKVASLLWGRSVHSSSMCGIAATNKDLEEEISRGISVKTSFYRLNASRSSVHPCVRRMKIFAAGATFYEGISSAYSRLRGKLRTMPSTCYCDIHGRERSRAA